MNRNIWARYIHLWTCGLQEQNTISNFPKMFPWLLVVGSQLFDKTVTFKQYCFLVQFSQIHVFFIIFIRYSCENVIDNADIWVPGILNHALFVEIQPILSPIIEHCIDNWWLLKLIDRTGNPVSCYCHVSILLHELCRFPLGCRYHILDLGKYNCLLSSRRTFLIITKSNFVLVSGGRQASAGGEEKQLPECHLGIQYWHWPNRHPATALACLVPDITAAEALYIIK